MQDVRVNPTHSRGAYSFHQLFNSAVAVAGKIQTSAVEIFSAIGAGITTAVHSLFQRHSFTPLNENQDRLCALTIELERRQQRITTLEATISEKETMIRGLRQTLGSFREDNQRNCDPGRLRELETNVLQLRELLFQNEQEVSQLVATLTEIEGAKDVFATELTNEKQKVATLEREVTQLKQQLRHAAAVNQAVGIASPPIPPVPAPVPVTIDYPRAAKNVLANFHLLFSNANVFKLLTPNQTQLVELKIENLLKLQVQSLSTIAVFERMNLIRQIKQAQEALYSELQTLNVTPIEVEGSKVLTTTITNAAGELYEQLRRPEKIKLIQKYQPSALLDQLSTDRINLMYGECKKKESKIESLENGLNELVEYAKLGEELTPFYGITVNFNNGKFQIRGTDLENSSMGYTIFWFLVNGGIIDSPTVNWNGEQSFSVTEKELDKLQCHLDRVHRWYHDFSNIISDLLAGDEVNPPDHYISIAQKSVCETWSSLIRSTEEGKRALMRLKGDHQCLLLGQMSLNLDGHPEADFIKKQIEAIYKAEAMKSQDGKFKQFIIGTNRTNLDPDQMKKICPRLNRYLRFQKHIMAFTEKPSLLQGISHLQSTGAEFGYGSDENILRQYLITACTETFKKIAPSGSLAEIQRDIENALTPISASLEDPEPLYKAYETITADLMKKWMVLRFSPSSTTYYPTEAQITALYGSDRKKTYGSTPNTFRDLAKLFSSLKRSSTVVQAIETTPELGDHISTIQRSIEERLATRYHTLPEEGWPSSKARTREAINLLETFIASIIHRQESSVSDASTQLAFSQLTSLSLDITNLRKGCDEGLEGRLQSMCLALSRDHTPSLSSYAKQSLKQAIEPAIRQFTEVELYRQQNTSHNPVYEAELKSYFGIAEVAAARKDVKYRDLSRNAKEILGYVLKNYNPSTLYKLAKSFVENEMWLLTLEPNTEENSEKIYAYLKELGFEESREEIDAKYRVRGNKENPFQYALLEGDIEKLIPAYLIKLKLVQIASSANIHQPRCKKDGDDLQVLGQQPTRNWDQRQEVRRGEHPQQAHQPYVYVYVG